LQLIKDSKRLIFCEEFTLDKPAVFIFPVSFPVWRRGNALTYFPAGADAPQAATQVSNGLTGLPLLRIIILLSAGEEC
jgi:hypothetical protein